MVEFSVTNLANPLAEALGFEALFHRSGGPHDRVVRRFTISLWPTLAGVAGVFALPVLVGLGARWTARSAVAELERSNLALEIENASYREATGQLAGQISTLQAAVDSLGIQAAVDPNAGRAMEKLPAFVKSRAMGGAVGAASSRCSARCSRPTSRSAR